jgi:hypothetical protein
MQSLAAIAFCGVHHCAWSTAGRTRTPTVSAAREPGVAGHLRVLRHDFTKIETVFRAFSKLKAKDVLEFLFRARNQRVYVAATGRHALALECTGNLAPRHGLFEHVLAEHELHDAVDLAEILKKLEA